MTKHVIELNGQHYDALTGQLVVAPAKTAPKAKKAKAKLAVHKGVPKALDGFSRRPGAPRQTVPASTAAATRQPEKSKTLMRTAVSKPVVNKIHATAASSVASQPTTTEHPRIEATKPGRAIRANTIGKSSLISKFGKVAPVIQTAAVPVKEAPAVPQHHTATPPRAAAPPVHAPAAANVREPFQSAIDTAMSHQQPKAKRQKIHHRVARRLHVSSRVVALASVTLLVLGVGGIIVEHNIPTIAMRVASTRSGVNANLPAYQPAGYSLNGPIKYEPGEVSVNYASNSDNRSFNVTQKTSAWNSETLLENYVTSSKQPYQTFQANGRTIYIYDGNKATWVDGGIWFDVDGKANLTSDQLLRIAESL